MTAEREGSRPSGIFSLGEILEMKRREEDALRRILRRIKYRRQDLDRALDELTPQERLGALCRAAERMNVLP